MFHLICEAFSVEELFDGSPNLTVGRVRFSVFASFDDDEIHVARKEVASLSDSDSGFEFVTSSDPDLRDEVGVSIGTAENNGEVEDTHLDSRSFEICDSFGYSILETIFDSSSTE
jgi:hypothetical protein